MFATTGIATALDEITLVLFTTLAPSGALAVVLMGVPLVLARGSQETRRRINTWLCVPLVTAMVGLVASATHLGNPANALYVFLGVGRSPLSNEVFCAVVFLALAGVYWLYSFARNPRDLFQRAWMACTMVAGVAFVTAVAFAYHADTIASWSTVYVPTALWLNALVGGPLLALATLRVSGWQQASGRAGRLLVVLTTTALVVNVIVYGLQAAALPGIANGLTTASDLVPCYSALVVVFGVLAAVGVGIDACALFGRAQEAVPRPEDSVHLSDPGSSSAVISLQLSVPRAFFASALALAGIFVMRFAFYMMHMTV